MSEQHSTKIPKDWITLVCKVSPRADELVRSRCRRKGDMSHLINDALQQVYGAKEPIMPPIPIEPVISDDVKIEGSQSTGAV